MKYFSNSEAHYVQAVSQVTTQLMRVSDVTTSISHLFLVRRVFEVDKNKIGSSWVDTLCTGAQM